MAYIWNILDAANRNPDLSFLGLDRLHLMPDWNTSRFNSVIGSSTDVVFGDGRKEFTFGSKTASVQVFGDLLQFLYSPSEAAKGGAEFAGAVYSLLTSGSETAYTFGKRKNFNFHFSPGFELDRFNSGSFIDKFNLTTEDMKGLRYKVDRWLAEEEKGKAKMILPGLFCACMVALELLINLEFDISAVTNVPGQGALPTQSDGGSTPESAYSTGKWLLGALSACNGLFQALIEFVEKALCAADLLKDKMAPQFKKELELLHLDSWENKIKAQKVIIEMAKRFDDYPRLDGLDAISQGSSALASKKTKALRDLSEKQWEKIEGTTWWFRRKFVLGDSATESMKKQFKL